MNGLLSAIAWISLITGALCGITIIADILAGHRQKMAIMNIVWPITALYLGPLAVWGHWRTSRQNPHPDRASAGEPPFWQKVFFATTHCGAGCTLGDIVGEFAIFALGFTLAGSILLTDYVVDFTLAYLLGLLFQFLTIVPMRHLPPGRGIWEAIKADTATLTAFEIGLFLWMALMHFAFFSRPPEPNQAVYWFMMQLGMVAGFATSYPANWLMLRLGVKPAM